VNRPVLLLPVHRDRYAVPLEMVQEVLEPQAVTRLPDAPPSVLGIINVRGVVVGVLDTAVLLGLPPLGTARSVAVVRVARGLAGLATSARPAAEELGEDLGASQLSAALGRRRTSSGVATLLDLEAVLAPEALAG
jgi:purine-binding chemotaxis protein CheW